MAPRIQSLLICFTLVTFASCSKPTPKQRALPEPVATVSSTESELKTATRSCSIESSREFKLDDGNEIRIWNIKTFGLKLLTVRLLIVTNGNAETVNELEYKWQTWDSNSPPASGQLVFLIQDGKLFGVKGKRFPQISLDIEGSPSNTKTGKKVDLFLEGEFNSRMTNVSNGTHLSQNSVIYSQLFLSKADTSGTASLGSDLESVIASSKHGGKVIAVTLDWVPQ
jgi:hypothetical protein